MPIDKSFVDFLTATTEQPDICEFSPNENRLRMKEMYKKPSYDKELASIITIDKNILINNKELPIRIYNSAQKNRACLIWFHGGGFVFGNLDSSDLLCRKIAAKSNLTIVSVDYRLAPENKFPAAVEDAYEATNWALKNASELNIDADKILIGGASAGATLAAVACLMMRDKGFSGAIKHQLLMMPMIDNNFKNKSYEMYGKDYFLTTESIKYFLNHYVKNEIDLLNPYCLPGKAQNFHNLPPAMIITLECDPLRDEGEDYSNRLINEGNKVEHHCYSGLFHGFISQVLNNHFAENAVDEMVTSYVNNIKNVIKSNG